MNMSRITFIVLIAVVVTLGIMSMSYTIQKCGLGNALMLGKGGVYAAYSGMCDK